jgi:hypothetical protein
MLKCNNIPYVKGMSKFHTLKSLVELAVSIDFKIRLMF